MQLVKWEDLAKNPLEKESAVTIGVFDGVHRGHLLLLEKTKSKGLFSVVVTFTEHPRRALKPEKTHIDIISQEEKINVFKSLGIDALVLIDFSLEFSKTSGEDFLDSLSRYVNMRYLIIGNDFKCGHNGSFNSEKISGFCTKKKISCEIVPPLSEGGIPISSSRIRAALIAGDRRQAELLLGRRLP